jgi:hypothetical protein
MSKSSHENFAGFARRKTSSNRSFGVVVGGVFLLLALWPLVHAQPPRWWALIPALPLLTLAAINPALLQKPNEWWQQLGLLLGKIVSPIIMGAIYYLWITPIALILRLMKKRFLFLQFEPDAVSYWIVRSPREPDPARLRRPY